MVNNFEIEKKLNILIKNCGDCLEDVRECENDIQYLHAVKKYNLAIIKLMSFHDFLLDCIDSINENTECFDREFDKIEIKRKSKR